MIYTSKKPCLIVKDPGRIKLVTDAWTIIVISELCKRLAIWDIEEYCIWHAVYVRTERIKLYLRGKGVN